MPDAITKYSSATPLAEMPLGDLRDVFDATRHAIKTAIRLKVELTPHLTVYIGLAGGRMIGEAALKEITNYGQLTGWLAGIAFADRYRRRRGRREYPVIAVMPSQDSHGWDCGVSHNLTPMDIALGAEKHEIVATISTLDGAAAYSDACAAVATAARIYGEEW